MSAGSMFEGVALSLAEQTVAFSQTRHKVLAGNVANRDTPGYRARDLSTEVFQQRLQEAVAARRSGPVSPGDPQRGLVEAARQPGVEPASGDLQGMLYHDLSAVSMEEQMAEIAKNHGLHNLALAILRSQFSLLNAAISERA